MQRDRKCDLQILKYIVNILQRMGDTCLQGKQDYPEIFNSLGKLTTGL
jgi:hypothetical protein